MISTRTRALAILGDPIEHSLTPRIQNLALHQIGADLVNLAFRVAPQNLELAVRGAQSLGFLGLMITIPHKEAVLQFCDELHPSARAMGAANLLQFRSDGKIVGHSSDGWAAIKSLEEENVRVKNQRIAILGGGGAARSLALTFALEGAAHISILNRTLSRAVSIAEEVQKLGVSASAETLQENSLRDVDLLVNSTSLGMTPNISETPISQSLLRRDLAVYDIVYNPLETQLLREAREVGSKAIDGLGMLIYTNVYAAQVCANVEISAQTMREEALRALAEKHVS
ncbi:shikimate dehydrogenase [Abditibacterium utsteinense]|uniref:Shikimate dehydrogenase (NADP(+)) n=1 Tax=Abditibacterium utsteinense TaxID=1960156 RepID=A0A2S8SUH7_9BACT|nr:shikimate dehydrogenase [Abditibacterium utsteinense]PQV64451.1 shikimate dehydrogenase [Abditibacterium utsteinense]